MTQLVLNIENPALVSTLRKLVNAMDGVTIERRPKKRTAKCELGRIIEHMDEKDFITFQSKEERHKFFENL